MNLFLYSEGDEFLTRILLQSLASRKNWTCVDIGRFVAWAELWEEVGPNASDGRRRWCLGGRRLADGESGVVLDRVFSMKNCAPLFTNPEFGFLEWDAFLFAMRNIPGRYFSTLFSQEPSAWTLPLANQWSLISKTHPDLRTPAMEYPYVPNLSALDPDRAVIVPFNERYQWRPGVGNEGARMLGFERPQGRPVTILATPNGFLDRAGTPREAGELAMSICREWKIWFGEVLLFIDGPEMHFGMVNVQPSKSFDSASLTAFVDSQLTEMGA